MHCFFSSCPSLIAPSFRPYRSRIIRKLSPSWKGTNKWILTAWTRASLHVLTGGDRRPVPFTRRRKRRSPEERRQGNWGSRIWKSVAQRASLSCSWGVGYLLVHLILFQIGRVFMRIVCKIRPGNKGETLSYSRESEHLRIAMNLS